jgi:dipeptidyl aminopeptidase/acylaminoacyl peptidase
MPTPRRAPALRARFALAALVLAVLAPAGPLSAQAAQPAQVAPAAQPGARRAIAHEDVWLAKRLGAPVVSPDGRWAVVSVTEPAYEQRAVVSDLWIVPTDGSAPPRRLTATRGGESGAQWSPDGSRLVFSARRDGDDAAQLYVLDVAAGGEAIRVTTVPTGARSPRWSPDGRSLLFTSTLLSGAADLADHKRLAEERGARKYRARVYDGFPIRNWDRWLEDERPRLFVQAAEPGAEPRELLGGTELLAAPGFAGPGDDFQATWTPDGGGIVFVAATERHTMAHAAPGWNLYHLALAGGEPRALTAGAHSWGNPTFSPNGRRLYVTFNPSNEFVYNHTRLAVLPWPAADAPVTDPATSAAAAGMASAALLTAGFDRSISDFAVAPDGRTLYLTTEDHGRDRLWSMPAAGGEVRPLAENAAGVYGGLALGGAARGGPVAVARWESAVHPPELVRVDLRTGAHRPLSSFNAARAAAIDWQPLREFWFTSSDGRRIHNWIALPPDFDESRKYPLFVVMHGGPHGAWKDQFVLRWNYHLLAQPGYVVLLTNFKGSTGFEEAFAQAIQLDPLDGPAREINEAADEAIRRFPFIDATRQAAGGASYGGHLAYWQQGVTDRYRTLIAHAGAINMESQWGTSDVVFHREVNFGGPVWEQGPVWREQNPIRLAANYRTPMLLTIGELDYRVPLNTTLEAWTVLQRLQIPSRLVVFPEENHWIMTGENSRFFYEVLHDWLARYIGPEAPRAGQ